MHRGGNLGHPENTLKAFKKAQQEGASALELDVRLSADGTPYVCHDKDLKRVFAVDVILAQASDRDLQKINLISSLKEVLQSLDIPQFLNIELKSDQLFDYQLVRRVCEVVRQAGADKTVLFSSFNPLVLFLLSIVCPEIPRGFLISRASRAWAFLARAHLVHLDHKLIDTQEIQFWQDRGYPVVAWTVNSDQRSQELLSQGVISIISDDLPGDTI